MSIFNLIGNTGYYGPDYTGLSYCILGLCFLLWGGHGLYRTHRDKRLLVMREAVGEWAFFMGAMFEDCTYLSQESWDKDAKSHLEELVTLVGEWIPPEIRDEVEGREDHRVCANCGDYTDNFCIIEKGPPEVNWIEDIWVRMGMLGKPICGECYYQ